MEGCKFPGIWYSYCPPLGDLGVNARVDEESSSYRVAKVPLGGFRGETVEECKFPGI
jgi:hypothetical protein